MPSLKSNTYFNHDTSQLTKAGIELLLQKAPSDNRLAFFSDATVLSIITNRIIPTILDRNPSNGILRHQMIILQGEIQKYSIDGYRQSSKERLIYGSDSAKESVNDRIIDSDYTLDILYGQLIAYWSPIQISKNEVIGINLATRSLLQIVIDERSVQGNESFIAGASFSNTPASKMPDNVRRAGIPSYTGVDITVVATMGPFISALDDIKTITYSVHREVGNVYAFGSANRKGIVRGNRTIAGTIICTVRLDDPMMKLHPTWMTGEAKQSSSGDDRDFWRETLLNDQLPMFDILCVFQNEMGHASILSVFGMNITDVGQVMSINDNEIELTLTYGAIDVDIMKYVDYDDGGNIQPYLSDAYKARRAKIIQGTTVSNNPYVIPQLYIDPDTLGGFNSLV